MFYMFKITGKATSGAFLTLLGNLQHDKGVRLAGSYEGEDFVLVVLEVPQKRFNQLNLKQSAYKKLNFLGMSNTCTLNPDLYGFPKEV